MSTRQIALAAAFLAIVFIAHAAGRVLQIGGAQLAPSIAIYVLMALLMAPNLGWAALVGIGLAVGILTMVATSSPFPVANIPAHGLGFLLSAYLAKQASGEEHKELSVVHLVVNVSLVILVSWTLFALVTWLGLASTPFTQNEWARFGANLGTGFFAWWLFGFIGVAVPTAVIAWILTPLLYRAVRPALVRQGMIEAAG
ncbi:MAG: hypothetical protein ACE5H9_19650 [Anaerolineae bacterium]